MQKKKILKVGGKEFDARRYGDYKKTKKLILWYILEALVPDRKDKDMMSSIDVLAHNLAYIEVTGGLINEV